MLNQICILGQSPKYLVMINYPLFMLLYFICWHPLNVWRLRSWGVLAPDFLWFYIISVSPHWVSVAVCGHSLVAARGAALPAVCSLLTAGTSLVAARGLWSIRLSSSGPGFGWPSARGLSQARKTHVPASAGGFLTAEPPGLSSSVLCSFCCPCLALCQPFTPYEQALEVVPCSCPGGFACHRCFLKCHIHFTNKLTWL